MQAVYEFAPASAGLVNPNEMSRHKKRQSPENTFATPIIAAEYLQS
jgi:hypothetical protein